MDSRGTTGQIQSQDNAREVENQRIINFITHQALIKEASSLSAASFEERLMALKPLTAPQDPATTIAVGLPQQGNESLFDAILKHPALEPVSKFNFIKCLINTAGYKNYMYMLFEEPAVNRLLAFDNVAPSLADLYVIGVKDHGVTMKPAYENELWKKMIKGGDSCCEFLLQELVATAMPAQHIADYVAFWRDQTIDQSQPAAVAAFYRNVAELTSDAKNTVFDALIANMSGTTVTQMPPVKSIAQDMNPGVMSAPMTAVPVMTRMPTQMLYATPVMMPPVQQPPPVIDYPTFRDEYLREVKHDLDRGEYKADAEIANWSMFISHNDAELLYTLFNAQPGSDSKRQLILLFLFVWMQQAINFETTRKKVFEHYELLLRCNTMHQPTPGEHALWKALLKGNSDYHFGREVFIKVLSHHGNTAKMLDFESVWLASIDNIDQMHLAEHHGIKMCEFLGETDFGKKHKEEIKMVSQVRGLEWMAAHPTVVVSKDVEDWLESGQHGKHSSREVFGLFKKFKADKAKEALAAYRTHVEEHINTMYEKAEEKEGIKGNHFKF